MMGATSGGTLTAATRPVVDIIGGSGPDPSEEQGGRGHRQTHRHRRIGRLGHVGLRGRYAEAIAPLDDARENGRERKAVRRADRRYRPVHVKGDSMRTLGAVVFTLALLGGAAGGAAGQDVDTPPSTEVLLADYVTEEIEPGVLALSGQVESWDLLAGTERPPRARPRSFSASVAPDGTVWTAHKEIAEKQRGQGRENRPQRNRPRFHVVRSFDGESWTEHLRVQADSLANPALDIGPDGTVWVSWVPASNDRENVVARYAPDGWQQIEPVEVRPAGRRSLHATDDGVVWLVGEGDNGWLFRYVDGAWQRLETPDLVTVGADGTAWGIDGLAYGGDPRLLALDGDRWREFEWPRAANGKPMDRFVIREAAHAAPDGSIWLGLARDPGPGEATDQRTGSKCEGLARFDGARWDRYLADVCIRWVEVAPDGAILAGTHGTRDDPDITTAGYLVLPQPVVVVTE